MEHMCFNFSEEVGYSDWQLPLGCDKTSSENSTGIRAWTVESP